MDIILKLASLFPIWGLGVMFFAIAAVAEEVALSLRDKRASRERR